MPLDLALFSAAAIGAFLNQVALLFYWEKQFLLEDENHNVQFWKYRKKKTFLPPLTKCIHLINSIDWTLREEEKNPTVSSQSLNSAESERSRRGESRFIPRGATKTVKSGAASVDDLRCLFTLVEGSTLKQHLNLQSTRVKLLLHFKM